MFWRVVWSSQVCYFATFFKIVFSWKPLVGFWASSSRSKGCNMRNQSGNRQAFLRLLILACVIWTCFRDCSVICFRHLSKLYFSKTTGWIFAILWSFQLPQDKKLVEEPQSFLLHRSFPFVFQWNFSLFFMLKRTTINSTIFVDWQLFDAPIHLCCKCMRSVLSRLCWNFTSKVLMDTIFLPVTYWSRGHASNSPKQRSRSFKKSSGQRMLVTSKTRVARRAQYISRGRLWCLEI